MRLKLDENLGRRGAERLQTAGHDVATIADEGLCTAPDRTVLAACSAEHRALVTLDLDFANPLVFDPRSHYGVAVLRLPKSPGPKDLMLAVETLVTALSERNLAGRLWIVEVGRIREHESEPDFED